MPRIYTKIPPAERFWVKVNKTDTCWLWTGSIKANGYGEFRPEDRNVMAHRFAYESQVGPVPDGLQLDHKCMVRACVNPAHLEPVTNAENTRRAFAAKGPRTHCRKGHEMTEDNVYVRPPGALRPSARYCRICKKANDARRRARNKEAKR